MNIETTKRFVSYYRVSTQKQGRSGLGLAAQRSLVVDHVTSNGGEIVAEFTEIESGYKPTRLHLEASLAACRMYRATLIVGTQERLMRDRSTFFNLLDKSGIPIVFADDPHGTSITIGMKAVMADEEGRWISIRTRRGLAEAKNRGVKLGSHREGFWTAERDKKRKAALERGRTSAIQNRKAKSEEFTSRVLPTLQELRAAGLTYRQMIDELEKRKIYPPRADKWSTAQLWTLLKKAEATA